MIPMPADQGRPQAPSAWAEIERRKQANEPTVPSEVVLQRLRLLEAEVERRQAAGEKDFTEDEAVEFIHRLRHPDPGAAS